MSGALEGLKVIDLSRILAGPFCSMMLGDHGADVIKVEPPGGDDTRQWGPPFVGAEAGSKDYRGESAYYLFCNRNKRGMVLDLSAPQGQEVLLRLIADADVVVENFRLGTMERWGLGYEAVLQKRNRRLIYVNISGFGADGPSAHMPGYDVLAQASGGLMSVTGAPDAGPTRVGIAIADLSTGMYAMQGILLALAARERTGCGQRVDCSLLESIVSLLTHLGYNYLVGGMKPRRYGNTHPSIVPYQLFLARDSHLYLAVGNDRQFQKLCACIGRPDLAQDALYRTNADRVANRDTLIPAIQSALAEHPVHYWLELFRAEGVPAAPGQDLEAVFRDPQVLHRQMVLQVPHPTAGNVRMTGIPVKLQGTPGEVRRHPPLFGEHTRIILAEHGYTQEEISALEQADVVQSCPGARGVQS